MRSKYENKRLCYTIRINGEAYAALRHYQDAIDLMYILKETRPDRTVEVYQELARGDDYMQGLGVTQAVCRAVNMQCKEIKAH